MLQQATGIGTISRMLQHAREREKVCPVAATGYGNTVYPDAATGYGK
jgi:hypothetical protein